MNAGYESLIRIARSGPACAFPSVRLDPPWGRAEIEKILPHRAGCLIIDSIVAMDKAARSILGRIDLRTRLEGFGGHFPGDPVYPAALQLEAFGQLTACLLGELDTPLAERKSPLWLRVLRVHHAFFSREIRPGETIDILGLVLESSPLQSTVAGQLLCGREVCSFALMDVCHD